MIDNRAAAIALILRLEGGYVADPRDPGGCTNRGITLATYRAYINRQGTCRDLRQLTASQAEGIYRIAYWDVIQADRLPVGVDLSLFDVAVHSGPGRAPKLLRAALRNLRLDPPASERIDATLLAALRTVDPAALARELVVARLAYLRSLPTWSRYERGWTNRVMTVRDAAYALIDQQKKTQEPRR